VTNSPRLELLIAKHGRTIVIGLVAIGILSVLATGWVVANPATTTTTQEVGEERVETDLQTSAEVVEDGLWDEGTILENNAAYVVDSTPELEVALVTTVPSDDTHVEHRLALEYEATRGDEVFWSEEVVLANETATPSDEAAVTETTIDIREVIDEQAAVEDQLEGISDVSLTLAFETSYETDSHVGTLTGETPFVITGETYYLEEHPSDSDANQLTQTVEETESPSSALVGLLILLAGGAFAGASWVNGRSDIDVAQARQALHEQRYAEWISRGSLPMWIGDEHVGLDTLEDVVDVAIDTNERVIHDRNRGLFAVVNKSVVYYYSDRGGWEQTAWPDFNLTRQSTDDQSESPPSMELEGDGPSDPIETDDLEGVDDLNDDDAWQNL